MLTHESSAPVLVPTDGERWGLRKLLWIVFLALVTVAPFAAAFIANYQPLTRGYAWMNTGECFRPLGEVTPLQGASFRAWRFSCTRGEPVSWSGGLSNDGLVPIRVTGLPLTDRRMWPLGPITAWYGPADSGLPTGGDWLPFKPFTLQPGDFYYVEFRATMEADCQHGATWQLPPGIEVDFEIGPIPRHDWVATGPGLQFDC